MVTFFGSASGADFGKTMLKTPFAIDALISSFCPESYISVSLLLYYTAINEVPTLRPCGNDKLLENLP